MTCKKFRPQICYHLLLNEIKFGIPFKYRESEFTYANIKIALKQICSLAT